MKKLLAITLLLICFGKIMGQQQEILFSPEFQPNKKYEIVMKSNSKMHVDMDSDDKSTDAELTKKLDSDKSMDLGMNMSVKNTILTKEKIENKIPFQMGFQEFNVNIHTKDSVITKNNPVVGTKIYGYYFDKTKIKIDSITYLKDLDPEFKKGFEKSLVSTIENMSANISYPEKPMKMGESFTQEIPMSLPIPNIGNSILVVTTYTLTAITEEKAYFDLVQTIKINMENTDEFTINSTGSGKGKCEYNIQDKITSLVQSNLDFQMDMAMGNKKVRINSNSDSIWTMNIK